MLDSWHGGYDRPGDVPATPAGGGGERPHKLTRSQYDELQARRHKDGRPMEPYLDGRLILRLNRRKGETALSALERGAPAFWSSVRSAIGSERAHRFRPMSWGPRGTSVLVVIAADEEDVVRWLPHDYADAIRRAERGDLRDLGEPLPRDVADAIHLATFPDGPKAVQEILDHLESLDDEPHGVRNPNTGAMEVRGATVVPAIGSRARHVSVPLIADPSPNRRRFAATVAVAEIMRGALSESDVTQLRVTGVTLTGTEAIVSFAPTEIMLSRPLRGRLTSRTVDEPQRIDDDMIESLNHRFTMALRDLGMPEEPPRRHSILRPTTYREAVRSGAGIHGVTVILFGLAWLLGPWAVSAILPLMGLAALVNVGLLPALLRWGPDALVAARRAVPRIGAGTASLLPNGLMPSRLPPPIDHWSVITRLAPEEGERIDDARARCDRLVAFAEGRMPSQEVVDAINSVQIHLPEMISNAATLAAEARPDERAAVVERALSVMDGVAAAADDARDGLLADARDRFSTSAGFLEARTNTSLSITEQRQ